MKLFDGLPEWVRSNRYFYSKQVETNEYDSDTFLEDESLRETSIEDANLISSDTGLNTLSGKTWHYPMIDIDMPMQIVASSTEGHGHLYIKKLMMWDDYLELLKVMTEVGLVQPGVLKAAKHNKRTCLRLPHIKKPQSKLAAWEEELIQMPPVLDNDKPKW